MWRIWRIWEFYLWNDRDSFIMVYKIYFIYYEMKRPWCWERLRAGGEGDGRGWDGWMASTTQCTWVWVDSGSWWWTGRTGVLQFMGSQRVRHAWLSNWTELNWSSIQYKRKQILHLNVGKLLKFLKSGNFWVPQVYLFYTSSFPMWLLNINCHLLNYQLSFNASIYNEFPYYC